jgi:hypothetical protein
MSYFDYQCSRTPELIQAPFYALIMAAMRNADTSNTEKLRLIFPAVYDEMYARYDAPGGVLAGEKVRA